MKTAFFKSIRTFFAAVLSVSLAFSVFSAFPAARAEETGETTDEKSYQYSVTIEFGAMAFCYDYGTWNSANLRYEVAEGERVNGPAAGTSDGFPGWYGFDGAANRISIKYTNTSLASDSLHDYLRVSLSYRALTESDGISRNATESIKTGLQGVTAEFYRNAALSDLIGNGNGTSLSIAKNNTEELWLSLRGEPRDANGAPFRSENLIPIGMLTISLGGFSASETTEGGN